MCPITQRVASEMRLKTGEECKADSGMVIPPGLNDTTVKLGIRLFKPENEPRFQFLDATDMVASGARKAMDNTGILLSHHYD